MCMLPDQSNRERSARLMSLDCDSLGRMVRGLTLYAVAEHFASVGDTSESDPVLIAPAADAGSNGEGSPR